MSATKQLEPVYSVRQLAERYNKSEYTIREWVNKRILPGAKRLPSGAIIVPQSAVEAFEDQAPEY